MDHKQFNRICIAWILAVLFISLAANAEDAVIIQDNDGRIVNVIDCSDVEDNDGCYEYEECCAAEELLKVRCPDPHKWCDPQDEVYCTFEEDCK